MGTKWEVWAYVPNDGPQGYGYEQVWGGASVIACVRAAISAKRAGAGCVRVEWR